MVISNKKPRSVKVIPPSPPWSGVKFRDPYKSGYRGIALCSV
jgi:hypothetical protein